MTHKIILIHKPTIKWLNDEKTHGIGGVTQPIETTIYLKGFEYENIRDIYNSFEDSETRCVRTLYTFTHQGHCTPHHKRKIWKWFRNVSEIQIKGL